MLKHSSMKKLLLFAFLASASALVAQPTFNSQDIFSVGTQYDTRNVNPADVNTGTTGANSTWDYSGLVVTSTVTAAAEAITDQPDAASFPNSSFVMVTVIPNDSTFRYYSITAQGLSLDGQTSVAFGLPFPPSATGPMIYTPGVDVFRFPSTFLSSISQPIFGTQIGIFDTVHRRGVSLVAFDGFGTLTTPEGTFNDVLRFSTVLNFTDSSTVPGVFRTWSIQSVTWISAATRGIPLLKKETILIDGVDAGSSAFFTDAGGVGIAEATESRFTIFPNPAINMVTIAGIAGNGKLSVELYSLTGQMISSLYNINTAAGEVVIQVPVNDVASGMYLIKINDGATASVKKIVIR